MKHSVKHSTTPQTRRGRGPAHRIGRSLALVLPVVLALLPGPSPSPGSTGRATPSHSVLTASDAAAPEASSPAAARAPHEVLRDRLLTELQEEDPRVAPTHRQEAVHDRPSLAKHCASLALRPGPRRGSG
ncbi:Membrane protein OS=Streptomyces fumanus OX=67302 GN=GCM10018772_30110 PE=4 SV=1 [Streptomyces fumanus]